MAGKQKYREVAINTSLGEDVLLMRDMTMTEELGRLFSMEMELFSADENLNFEKLLGENATIRLAVQKDKTRYFNGYITDFSQTIIPGERVTYQATLRPWLWFLTRTSDCRIFQNETVPDIIKKIFSDLGFTDFKESLARDYEEWEYCVQYRETDFNFVSRLMEQEGIYYFFNHENGKHILVLGDHLGAHEPLKDYETIPYYPPDDTTVRDDEHISSWLLAKQLQPGTVTLNDFDFERPKADLHVNSTINRLHSRADYEIYDYPGEYYKKTRGDGYVKARIEEFHANYEQAQASSDVRGLMCGGLFTLKNYPRRDQNRQYLIVSANHTVQSDAYESSGGAGGTMYSNSFSVIESKTAFRSQRITPKPVVQGPQTAIVVGPEGEEIHTDEHGRVKLQFHWDRYGKYDENSSCWVRVSQFWAGKQWGGIHLPRIGQEVIVEFLEGDPDHPIITGRVYNGDNKPPYELPEKATISGIKSLSSKGGEGFNEFHFEDKKGEEKIFLHAELDQHIRVKNDNREFIGNERHTIVKKSQFEQLEDGDMHLTVGGDINEKVEGTVSRDIADDLQEKVGGSYGLEAADIHLKAAGNIVIEAGAKITLKAGGAFIVIGPSEVAIVGQPVLINSGGSPVPGKGCSPEAAELPKKADDAKAGLVEEVPPEKEEPTEEKKSHSSVIVSDQVKSLVTAAENGTPFCEICTGK